MLLEIVMRSPSSTSVHNRRNEKTVLNRRVPLLALLSIAGVLVLALAFIVGTATSGGPSDKREADSGAAYDLVDAPDFEDDGQDVRLQEHREALEALQAEVDALSEELAGLQAELNTRTEELDELEAQLGTTEQPPAAGSEEESDDPAAKPPTESPETDEMTTGVEFYENCDEARANGAAPVHEGDPGFGPHLDADDDGIGCEE
jgi:peptidoglycan hydrolase CwlO-like protein